MKIHKHTTKQPTKMKKLLFLTIAVLASSFTVNAQSPQATVDAFTIEFDDNWKPLGGDQIQVFVMQDIGTYEWVVVSVKLKDKWHDIVTDDNPKPLSIISIESLLSDNTMPKTVREFLTAALGDGYKGAAQIGTTIIVIRQLQKSQIEYPQ